MVRLALLALSAAAIPTFTLAAEKAAAPASRPSGFQLPAFNGSYPGQLFRFDGERAKLLVREVLPVVMDDVARVAVQEDTIFPGGHYWGLTIDIALKVRASSSPPICEEPHVYITYQYKGPYVGPGGMRPTVRGGTIANHAFDRLYLRNRYFTMSETGASQERASAICASLATDTSGWREASNMSEYAGERRRTEALFDALATLPKSQVQCMEPQGSACSYRQSEILSLVQTSPRTIRNRPPFRTRVR
ncbi:hypothetical protein E2493_20420 [Sphingomonas parva]|uniref:DUF4468 domain-containing protein n=1 Tax=Sphingomonas parva TaxID=2555898 RepID=A0A4Y8ZK59_9SPHN|nr:hypothetical protein [Sphingomonas parva]TFI56331.1 hypothetical protein E2493_20695 [Sphingomonas parva]TFI56332.1 hypothetical protein E2493_20700 [Sphingomonas parva]TFI56389.1 hypothetical protein E2493_20415 [Sphingomonas parva]TFI56390.1 hypothetical protein E2493_20420 [Sphingomonas parva]